MIEVSDLTHDYEGKGKPAVSGVSFTLERGTIFGFLGPSGAGKSTVQNIMTALLPIQHGDVRYDGISVRGLPTSFFNRVGYSFEHPNVYAKLTGYENLKYYAGLFDVPTEDPAKLLGRVGLESAMHQRAGRYSKGMKQRLVFCRAILNRPEILFLDEPTSGLDPSTASVVREIIREKRDEGAAVILTTHDMSAADELCDTVAFLDQGKIAAMDTPRNLKLRYGTDAVKAEYLDGGVVRVEVLSPSKAGERERLHRLIDSGTVQTLHSMEATLAQIFIDLTGRGLAP